MKIVKQLSVFMANRPGALAQLIRILADQKVNVEAFSVSDTVDHAVVRMVVNEPAKALHLLGESGILCVENDVVEIGLANRPGALKDLAQRLGRASVNIEYGYGSAGGKNGIGALYLRVDDAAKVKKVLGAKRK